MQTKMKPAEQLPSANEAIKIINNSFDFFPQKEEVSVFDAVNRVLAEDVLSEEYVPTFNRSGMDGYSVHVEDVVGAGKDSPVALKLQGEVLMGFKAEEPLKRGYCVYTPTGAAVPEGTDAVIMVEKTKKNDDGTIIFYDSIEKGKNVTLKGDDVYPGKKVLPKGRILSISDIGALCAMGKTSIAVHKKPVIGIISTGDELVEVDQIPEDGQIRDINSTTLALLMNEIGGISKLYGITADEEDVLKNKIKLAVEECDMVLVSGGSSMGEKDATEKIVDDLGELILHGIRIKPGKPVIAGKIKNKPVFGVPGHPISAFFVSRVFVKNVVMKMLGTNSNEIKIEAVLTDKVKVNKERTQFNFAKLYDENGDTMAIPLKTQSGLITSMACCDAFFAVECTGNDKEKGEKIILHPIR